MVPAQPTKRPPFHRDGRWLFAAVAIAYLGLFFTRPPGRPGVEVAKTWGVEVMRPTFADLYVIPAAAASKAQGLDPYVDNPRDPWKRPFNYPAVWLALSPRSLSSGAIAAVALTMTAAALLGLLAYAGPLSRSQGLVLAAIGCSPPLLLAVERGNTDLLILALVAGSLAWLRHGGPRSRLGYAGIAAAAFLKLFPLAAGVVVLREPRASRRLAVGMFAATAAACLALNAAELPRIIANTGTGVLASYGCGVLGQWVNVVAPLFGVRADASQLARVGLALAAVVLLLAAWQFRRSTTRGPVPSLPHVDGLRVGSAIYLCTFVLGSSFDYRLLFLLLGVPGLLEMLALGGWARRWARAALLLMFPSFWLNGIFMVGLGLLSHAATWALCFVLTGILLRTQDVWVPGRPVVNAP